MIAGILVALAVGFTWTMGKAASKGDRTAKSCTDLPTGNHPYRK